jgi:hypothetical protein
MGGNNVSLYSCINCIGLTGYSFQCQIKCERQCNIRCVIEIHVWTRREEKARERWGREERQLEIEQEGSLSRNVMHKLEPAHNYPVRHCSIVRHLRKLTNQKQSKITPRQTTQFERFWTKFLLWVMIAAHGTCKPALDWRKLQTNPTTKDEITSSTALSHASRFSKWFIFIWRSWP